MKALKHFKHIALGTISNLGLLLLSPLTAFAGGVTITNYGHSALLINGSGKSVLVNPFKAVGCAAGLTEPKVNVNLILASSELADEGARVARGKYLVKPGSFRINGLDLESFAIPHDRFGGRRFGQSTVWRWEQGGLTFAHLGGSAGPLSEVDKVLLGRPDVLIIGVGGGAKVYNGDEAAQIVKELNPRRVIPVQYVRQIKKPANCDQTGIQPFLDAIAPIKIRNQGPTIDLPSNLSEQTVIEVLQ